MEKFSTCNLEKQPDNTNTTTVDRRAAAHLPGDEDFSLAQLSQLHDIVVCHTDSYDVRDELD